MEVEEKMAEEAERSGKRKLVKEDRKGCPQTCSSPPHKRNFGEGGGKEGFLKYHFALFFSVMILQTC